MGNGMMEQEFDTQQNEKDLVGFDVEELDEEDLLIEPKEKLMHLQVYIACSAKDQQIAQKLVVDLLSIKVQSVSQWVNMPPINDTDLSNSENCRYYANMDLGDIDKSQLLILLASDSKSPGKTSEFGYAIAEGKPILFVGKPYSVFHHHKSVTFFDNTDDLLAWLNQSLHGVTNAVRLAALL